MYLVQYSMPFVPLLAGPHSNQNPYPSYSVPPPGIASAPSVPVVPSQTPTPAPNAASHFTSTLPPSYHQQYVFEEEEYNDAEQSHPGYYIEHSLSHAIAPFMSSHQSGLVRHYLDHVLQRQYLLADTSIADFIVRTVQQNPAVRDAVCLLASLHQESLRQGNASTGSQSNTNDNAVVVHNEPYADSTKTYKRICDSLRTSAAGGYTEGEAMAGLFVVSAFLFRGGRGAWQQFLAVAAEWVWNVLNSSADPAEAIRRCSDSQQFVIKTTFWFDILASTTRLEPPRFISIYRKLWAPRSAGAYIETAAGGTSCGSSCYACCGSGCCSGNGAGAGVCDAESGGPCGCSGSQAQSTLCMMSVMGCGNVTALAIAETSALACWKEAHLRQGTLSIPEPVDRGRAIEAECLTRVPVQQQSHVHAHPQQQQQQQQQQHPHSHHSHSHHPHPPSDGVLYPAGGSEAVAVAVATANADLAAKRRLTAEIFRATARVYLHSV